MNDNLTILVNSCDKYEEAWEPFFRLLYIQWPDCPYEIVLNTETKTYHCDYLNVRTVAVGKGVPWGKRIITVLNAINTEYIIYLLEDEFLNSPVNGEAVNRMLEYMKANSDVGVIFTKHTDKQKNSYEEPYFDRDLIANDRMRIVGISALYRKTYFLQLLRDEESPWDFEKNATSRSKALPYRVLQYNKSEPIIFDYNDSPIDGWGLTAGRWIRGTESMLSQYGISVDYSKLGWYEPTLADYKKYASVHSLILEDILPDHLKAEYIRQEKKSFKSKLIQFMKHFFKKQ